jgi:hypothetical protein
VCERRVARRKGARAKRSVRVNPNPKPRPIPKPSSADVAEKGVASIGVRSSGNLCVDEEWEVCVCWWGAVRVGGV